MTDLGGEPACWAHLVDDIEPHEQTGRVTHVDISHVGRDGSGAVWSLPHDGDLDANLVRLRGGEQIEQHVNDDLDVLVVVWHGTGEMTVDDHTLPLRPGVVVLVPRGSRRSIRAGSVALTYLTVHRRRGPLTIGRP